MTCFVHRSGYVRYFPLFQMAITDRHRMSDRNGGNAKIIPEEVEKRRSLFWELLYLDARLVSPAFFSHDCCGFRRLTGVIFINFMKSLSLGRPPSLSIRYMDCPRPSYIPDHGCDPSESLHYCRFRPYYRNNPNTSPVFCLDQEWKHTCYTECLAPVLDVISQPSLEYSVVIDLDNKIRDFSSPPPLRNGAPHTRSLLMQKASLSIALEAGALRCFPIVASSYRWCACPQCCSSSTALSSPAL